MEAVTNLAAKVEGLERTRDSEVPVTPRRPPPSEERPGLEELGQSPAVIHGVNALLARLQAAEGVADQDEGGTAKATAGSPATTASFEVI